jgi:hypothetical protein
MIIALVSEFAQVDYFQWHKVWSLGRQRETGILVKDVIIDPVVVKAYLDDSPYWQWIRKADFVFVYCSRLGSCGGVTSLEDSQNWAWWKLPLLAKKFMKPEAKMVVQWDDEFIWLFHPKWNWFSDQPDPRPPEQFFRETGILDIADENWTVLENPPWAQYSHKPIRYMPLPHLWRYGAESSIAEGLMAEKGIFNMHGKNIALLRHTGVISSVNHTVVNVAEKIGMPIEYFITSWNSKDGITSSKIKVTNIERSSQSVYVNRLAKDCVIAIDDAENYIGWSRFVMECALAFVPCIGSNYSTKLFFPELFTAHKDYARQIELINELLKSPEFYERVVRDGRTHMLQHLNTDRLCNEMIRIAREDLKVEDTTIDVNKELFMTILDKMLPWTSPPKRPSKPNATVFDNFNNGVLDQTEWDKLWGVYEKFISDEKVLRELIKEVLRRKHK